MQTGVLHIEWFRWHPFYGIVVVLKTRKIFFNISLQGTLLCECTGGFVTCGRTINIRVKWRVSVSCLLYVQFLQEFVSSWLYIQACVRWHSRTDRSTLAMTLPGAVMVLHLFPTSPQIILNHRHLPYIYNPPPILVLHYSIFFRWFHPLSPLNLWVVVSVASGHVTVKCYMSPCHTQVIVSSNDLSAWLLV